MRLFLLVRRVSRDWNFFRVAFPAGSWSLKIVTRKADRSYRVICTDFHRSLWKDRENGNGETKQRWNTEEVVRCSRNKTPFRCIRRTWNERRNEPRRRKEISLKSRRKIQTEKSVSCDIIIISSVARVLRQCLSAVVWPMGGLEAFREIYI